MLRMKGYQVIEAADGTEALTLLREHKDPIAVVLLDVTLPGAPSREVFAEARHVRPDIKVIVTSAYAEDKVNSSLPGMVFDSFLRKPYRLADLENLIRELLHVSVGRVKSAFPGSRIEHPGDPIQSSES